VSGSGAPAVRAPRAGSRRPWWQVLLLAMIRVVLITVLVVCGFLLWYQDRLIYLIRRYPEPVEVPAGVERLDFTTAAGAQTCWWVPPKPDHDRVWLAFAGNASLALGWTHLVATDDGLLLIDYPGYGVSAGTPSPATILDASEGAVTALSARAPTVKHWAVLGHSLGCAAALQYAARHPVERIVLVAPFTCMLEMAQRVVGWPLCHLLRHRFDNAARLAEILGQGQPIIDLWHGTADAVIPFQMGENLARQFPSIRFHPVADADHNGIVAQIAPQLLRP
jgi:uncharacterized protein